MFNEGIVGAQNQSDGTVVKARMGRHGDQLVSGLHGPAYERTYRKNSFNVATVAAGVTTVGLATTYTGLMLQNPYTSTVDVVMGKCTFAQSVIQATTLSMVGIAFGFTAGANATSVTAVATRSNYIGSGIASQANAGTIATLSSAPFYHTFLANSQTAILNNNPVWIDLDGEVILPPGGFACWVTAAVSPASSMWFSFNWEEVPR